MGIPDEQQPRFGPVKGCYFEPIITDNNKWHFVELKESAKGDADDAETARAEVLLSVTNRTFNSIRPGKIGAVTSEDRDFSEGFWLIEFTDFPDILQNLSWNDKTLDSMVVTGK